MEGEKRLGMTYRCFFRFSECFWGRLGIYRYFFDIFECLRKVDLDLHG